MLLPKTPLTFKLFTSTAKRVKTTVDAIVVGKRVPPVKAYVCPGSVNVIREISNVGTLTGSLKLKVSCPLFILKLNAVKAGPCTSPQKVLTTLTAEYVAETTP